MRYYLNVHFQGQRVKETGWEDVKWIHPIKQRDGSIEQGELWTLQESGNIG